MAKIDIPKDDDSGKKKPESQSKRRRQKNYQDALSYERAFQKKKEELSRSATSRQLKAEIAALQERAAVEIALAHDMIRDKETLEAELSRIRSQLASDLSQRQLALISEQRKNEYAAHEFATACAMKSFQTQNVHQRAQTAAAIADAQRIQTEKLRSIKSAEIADLQAQKKSAGSAEEKRRISSQIRKLQKEISDAEAQEAAYQQQAVQYSEIVRKVDFERLSAAEKLARKEQEVVDLRSQSESAVAEIDSELEAKKIDLAAAEESGDTKKADQLRGEISELETKKSETAASYETSINEVQESIDKEGGYRDQAKKDSGTKVLGIFPSRKEDEEEPEVVEVEDTAQNSMDIPTQLSLILSCVTNFVSAFETYVNALDARVTAAQQLQVSSNPIENPIRASQGLIGYLQTLADQSAGEDIELQTQLNDRISRLSDVLMANPDLDVSTLIKPLSEIDSIPAFDGFLGGLGDMLSPGKNEEDEDDEKSGPLDRARAALDARGDAFDLINKQQKEKDDAWYQRRVENEAQLFKLQSFFKKENSQDRKDALVEKAVETMQGALDKMVEVCAQIDEHIKNYFQYQADIDARLQGTDMTYQKMLKTLTNNLGMSMLIPQQKYIEQFKKITDSGIMHNMETRAFLATVQEKVINTFDVFDANLLKLIRIQQNDSTAARMGLESSLNSLFNAYFSDSSYLNDVHDSISGGILEASSMLSNEMSLEFEYMVHKWLGSLYSMGVSSDTLEAIAQGLNYLGTGNVQALNSNESLQTLLAMSANRGGESYADILVNGLDADTTNNLLRGMIEYLIEIASNTDNNQVTKSAYSDLFGLHMSDLRAIINLTENDISSLANLTTTYSKAVNETQNQLASIYDRTHTSQMVDVLFENAVLGAALDIGNSPVGYGLWKTLNLVEGLTGGIALPFVNVFGSGFDLNTTVTQLAKSGMAGLAMLGNLVSALGSGGLNSGMDINEWNNVEMTARGSADKFLATGTASGFSSSTRLDYAGSGSTSDIKKTEMSDAADSADEDSEIVNKNQQDAEDVPVQTRDNTAGIWAALAEEGDTVFKQSLIANDHLEEIEKSLSNVGALNALLAPTRVFLAEVLESGLNSQLTIDPLTGNVSMMDLSTQTTRMNAIKNAFTEIVDKSSDMLNSNVDIWSLIDAAGTTDSSSLKSKLSTMYTTNTGMSRTGFYNFDGDSTNQTANTNLINALSSQLSTNVQLQTYLKDYAQIQQLNKIVFPEYVRATIDDLAPGVKKYSEELIKRAVQMNIYGADDVFKYDEDNENATHPVVKQLKAWLSDPATVLRVEKHSLYG